MAAAVDEVDGFRTGMVAAVQTSGDLLTLQCVSEPSRRVAGGTAVASGWP